MNTNLIRLINFTIKAAIVASPIILALYAVGGFANLAVR